MYRFADGWMTFGAKNGTVRLRLIPVPKCVLLRVWADIWLPHKPENLFWEESRNFHAPWEGDALQPELPMSGESNPVNTSFLEDAGFPAFLLWQYAPDSWGELTLRFPKQGWEVLRFVAVCGSAAQDLTVSNPGLAMLLAIKHFGIGSNMEPDLVEPLREALWLPQIKLLPWVMLPQERWIVRFLSKVDCRLRGEDVLVAVQGLLQLRGAEEMVRHLKKIDERILRLIHPKILPVIRPRFFQELCKPAGLETSMDVITWKLKDAGDMAFMGQSVPIFESIRQLEKWHWEELGMKGKYSAKLPQHPFHGNRWIRAIDSLHKLQEEAHTMQHCVMDYQTRIEEGAIAMYAVLEPERATLALILNEDGVWRLYDLRLSHNRAASKETRNVVERWMRERQQKQAPF